MRLSVRPDPDPERYPFRHDIRVRFSETDAMGIVHHSRYLPYLEEARVAYLRELGHPYDELRAEGVDYAVLECQLRYLRPLRFDEIVRIHLRLAAATRATFQMTYLLTVEGTTCATAVTVHGCVDAQGRAARMPEWLGALAQDV